MCCQQAEPRLRTDELLWQHTNLLHLSDLLRWNDHIQANTVCAVLWNCSLQPIQRGDSTLCFLSKKKTVSCFKVLGNSGCINSESLWLQLVKETPLFPLYKSDIEKKNKTKMQSRLGHSCLSALKQFSCCYFEVSLGPYYQYLPFSHDWSGDNLDLNLRQPLKMRSIIDGEHCVPT